MELHRPAYFDTFRCIASACPDSCCQEWDVQVDPDKAELYRSLPGPLGQRLREVLVEEDGETIMTIIDRRCPMWRQDGLCRIQAELGEEALCHTCREFPRLTHDYGNFVEKGLELSCPEAARILLQYPNPEIITTQQDGGDEPEYDTEAMEVLLRTRETARAILADPGYTTNEALAQFLLYGYQAQGELDGDESAPFHADAALEDARQFAAPADVTAMLDFFAQLEILTLTWPQRLKSPAPTQWSDLHRALGRYFLDRYWLQAVSDYDLVSRVKLTVISCLMVRILGGDPVQTAQQYSKEIENSIENLEAVLDGAYRAGAFTDVQLLGLLLL